MPDQSVPVTTVPMPAQREDPVDVEARRPGGVARRRAVGNARERSPQLVEARPRLGADGDDLGLGHELARLLDRELERLLVDEV